ncbi:AAA family ATPase [Acidithiobacillus montserratensis]|uniref:AAA family ATPase n=1 Tax=Acidithiobacillus montserratensis TaxID=2729135 RepID=A0ACD5HJ72_9PROT|nr:UvrD-helicase domain-containing protein [Acidithiobacillus montserratensis]MBU2746580.1 ATP-dependent helicase [Acidithiobacillus montserratensis]
MQLTDEQKAAVAMAMRRESFKISALAGTGKTTTLVAIASALPGLRGLYLSFNKIIALEAQKKFSGTGCEARTFHSLAFSGFGKKYGARLNKRLNPGYLRSRFHITGDHAFTLSEMVLGTVGKFLRTADNTVSMDHIHWGDMCASAFAMKKELDEAARYISDDDLSEKSKNNQLRARADMEVKLCHRLSKEAVKMAQTVFEEMSRTGSDVPVSHDLYLREYILTKPDLSRSYDYLLFDEAQDADGLMLLLTEAQKIPVFYVGDAFQQIYAWRGAKNAMQSLDLPETQLTTSFRFGQEIADDANVVLESLGARHFLRGRPGFTSRVLVGGGGKAVISRTNEGVMASIQAALSRGVRAGASGRRGILGFLRDYESLVNGRPTGAFSLFKDDGDLRSFADSDGGKDLAVFLKLVDTYGLDELRDAMERVVDLDTDKDAWRGCDHIAITAHKSKGMEFDEVSLAEDLFFPKRLESEEERRLLYVAKTRAIRVLHQPMMGLGMRTDSK